MIQLRLAFFIIMIGQLFFSSALFAQAFHFQNLSTTIIKTTAQSPAHDYIEIFNDAGVDTMLRWKADVSGVPSSWTITFDDQNNFYNNILTGDSADFVLYDSLQFPQKLIIGAFTNNVAASGSVYFEIYNPADTAQKITIEYLFIITNPVGIHYQNSESSFITISESQILFRFIKQTPFQILSEEGKQIYSATIKNGVYDFKHLPKGVYFLCFNNNKKHYVKKFVH